MDSWKRKECSSSENHPRRQRYAALGRGTVLDGTIWRRRYPAICSFPREESQTTEVSRDRHKRWLLPGGETPLPRRILGMREVFNLITSYPMTPALSHTIEHNGELWLPHGGPKCRVRSGPSNFRFEYGELEPTQARPGFVIGKRRKMEMKGLTGWQSGLVSACCPGYTVAAMRVASNVSGLTSSGRLLVVPSIMAKDVVFEL